MYDLQLYILKNYITENRYINNQSKFLFYLTFPYTN